MRDDALIDSNSLIWRPNFSEEYSTRKPYRNSFLFPELEVCVKIQIHYFFSAWLRRKIVDNSFFNFVSLNALDNSFGLWTTIVWFICAWIYVRVMAPILTRTMWNCRTCALMRWHLHLFFYVQLHCMIKLISVQEEASKKLEFLKTVVVIMSYLFKMQRNIR